MQGHCAMTPRLADLSGYLSAKLPSLCEAPTRPPRRAVSSWWREWLAVENHLSAAGSGMKGSHTSTAPVTSDCPKSKVQLPSKRSPRGPNVSAEKTGSKSPGFSRDLQRAKQCPERTVTDPSCKTARPLQVPQTLSRQRRTCPAFTASLGSPCFLSGHRPTNNSVPTGSRRRCSRPWACIGEQKQTTKAGEQEGDDSAGDAAGAEAAGTRWSGRVSLTKTGRLSPFPLRPALQHSSTWDDTRPCSGIDYSRAGHFLH